MSNMDISISWNEEEKDIEFLIKGIHNFYKNIETTKDILLSHICEELGWEEGDAYTMKSQLREFVFTKFRAQNPNIVDAIWTPDRENVEIFWNDEERDLEFRINEIHRFYKDIESMTEHGLVYICAELGWENRGAAIIKGELRKYVLATYFKENTCNINDRRYGQTDGGRIVTQPESFRAGKTASGRIVTYPESFVAEVAKSDVYDEWIGATANGKDLAPPESYTDRDGDVQQPRKGKIDSGYEDMEYSTTKKPIVLDYQNEMNYSASSIPEPDEDIYESFDESTDPPETPNKQVVCRRKSSPPSLPERNSTSSGSVGQNEEKDDFEDPDDLDSGTNNVFALMKNAPPLPESTLYQVGKMKPTGIATVRLRNASDNPQRRDQYEPVYKRRPSATEGDAFKSGSPPRKTK